MTNSDKQRIRELAKEQLEFANDPKMKTLATEWTALNDGKLIRPMVTVELGTFADDILPQLMQCETEEGRRWERMLLSNIVNHKYFKDDTFVRDFIPVSRGSYFKPFDLDTTMQHTDGVGYHFVSVLTDLEEDFEKLKPSSFGISPKEEMERYADEVNDLIGDILPAKQTGNSLYAVPTQNLVHLMNMEDLYIAMYDAPELFKKMMDMLADDYLAYYDLMEKEGILLPTVSSEWLGQGTYCFNSTLPRENVTSTTQLWGFMDSQESTGISPEMFAEFIFPCYKKIAARYGMLSYGCCEAVDPIWENCLSTLPNLRRVSISPWCNEEKMGEILKGTNIVYHRKPAPNFLGVGRTLDEDGFRAHIRKTVNAAKGCNLEITQRDVYTVGGSIDKVRRYVEIVREECENF